MANNLGAQHLKMAFMPLLWSNHKGDSTGCEHNYFPDPDSIAQ